MHTVLKYIKSIGNRGRLFLLLLVCIYVQVRVNAQPVQPDTITYFKKSMHTRYRFKGQKIKFDTLKNWLETVPQSQKHLRNYWRERRLSLVISTTSLAVLLLAGNRILEPNPVRPKAFPFGEMFFFSAGMVSAYFAFHYPVHIKRGVKAYNRAKLAQVY
jgi:hypothetical protein